MRLGQSRRRGRGIRDRRGRGLLHGIGCLGDYHPDKAFERYCERNTRGERTLPTVGAGALSVWRRQVLYVLVGAVLLIPLAFVLPFLVLS